MSTVLDELFFVIRTNPDPSGTAAIFGIYENINRANDNILEFNKDPASSGLYSVATTASGVSAFPKGWVHDCKLSYTSASGVLVGSGVCRDFNDSFNIRLNENVSVLITASGIGGLDTGSEASDTWYAVHIIADSTESNNPSALLSLSAHNPTLPTGYDKFRRVGWVRNDSSSKFLKFTQIWNGSIKRYGYDHKASETRVISGGNAITFTEINLSSFIPPTSNNVIFLSEFETSDAGSSSNELKMRPKGFSAAISDSLWQQRIGVVSTFKARMQHEVPCVDQTIEYRVDDGDNNVHLAVAGFDDEL